MKLISLFIFLFFANSSYSYENTKCENKISNLINPLIYNSNNLKQQNFDSIIDFVFNGSSTGIVLSRFNKDEISFLDQLISNHNYPECTHDIFTFKNKFGGISITGSVKEQNTNTIITDGNVIIYNSNGDYLGLTSINNQGKYSYSGLAAGTYYIRTDNTGYYDELWNNIPCAQGDCVESNGTPININGSSFTANFSLVQGGSISGYVKEQGTNAIITDGIVIVYDSNGDYLGLTSINNQGSYSYSGLADGTYYIRTDNTGYFDELWNNIPCADGNCTITNGTEIVVSNTDITANFLLTKGGSISGSVAEQGSNVPITDGIVIVYETNGNYLGLTGINNQGNYSYSGLAPGTYYIRTDNTGYFDELWNNIPCADGNCTITNGTEIVVSNTDITANFLLSNGGLISGSVTEQDSNAPITDGNIIVYDSNGVYLGLTSINNQGNYSYSGLAAGTYYIRTDNTGYFDELWNNIPCAQGDCIESSGTPIILNGLNFTANFSLTQGGIISGFVREHGTNNAITDGVVIIYDSNGNYLGLTGINSQGNYSYSGLADGIYYIRTDNTGYFDELWNNIPCAQGACTVTNGTSILISDNVFVANFVLGNSFVDLIFLNGFEEVP